MVLDGASINYTSNEVYNAAMSNLNDAYGSGGWPSTVGTYFKQDGSNAPSSNINFTNNYIHDSWGEGIAPNYLDGGTVKGNIIKDGFGVLIYLDRAKNMTVDSNYVYMTTDKYSRNGKRPDGIGISTEIHSSGPAVTASNITVSNNLILGTYEGINYWHDTSNTNSTENTYSGLKIYYNVIKDTASTPFHVYSVSSPYTAPGASEFRNNIVYKGGDATSIYIGNASAWTLSNNDWPTSGSVPSPDSTANNSFVADPLFVNPAPAGGPYAAIADGYRVQVGSPVIGKGVGVAANNDFYGTSRPTASTTIGFYEYVTIPTPTPTLVPTFTPVPSPTPSSTPTATPISSPPASNLIQNPGCEVDTSGWIGSVAVLSRNTLIAHSGIASCQISYSGSSTYYSLDDNPDTVIFSSTNPAIVGITYTATAWVRTDSAFGKTAQMSIRRRGGTNATLNTNSIVSLSSNWQQLTVTASIDANDRTSLDVYIYENSPSIGNSMEVDDISLVNSGFSPPTSTPTPKSHGHH